MSGISQKEVAQNPQVGVFSGACHVTRTGSARRAGLLHGGRGGRRRRQVHDAQEETCVLCESVVSLTAAASMVQSPSLPSPSAPIISHPTPKLEPVRKSHERCLIAQCIPDAAGAGRAGAPCPHRVREDQGSHTMSRTWLMFWRCSPLCRRRPPSSRHQLQRRPSPLLPRCEYLMI